MLVRVGQQCSAVSARVGLSGLGSSSIAVTRLSARASRSFGSSSTLMARDGDDFRFSAGLGKLRSMPGMGGDDWRAPRGSGDGPRSRGRFQVGEEELKRMEEELNKMEGADEAEKRAIMRRTMLRALKKNVGEGESEDEAFDQDSDDPRWQGILKDHPEGAQLRDVDAILTGDVNHSQDPDPGLPPYRQPRPLPTPLKAGAERRIKALREGPLAKLVPEFLDYLEHEAWIDRYRDGESGGAFLDRTIAPWDEFCEEDALYRNVLTDDEYNIPEDYEEPVYVPDRIRSQIYFQWAHKGLSIAELAQRYKLRSERVAAFILFKRSEPDYAARGMVNKDTDKLMEALYGAEAQGKTPMKDWDNGGDNHDQGLDVALLRDAQVPDDCFPVMKFRGNRLRGAFPLHAKPIPPRAERDHKSRFAIRDVSAGDGFPEQRRARHIVVDFDGTRRPATRREELSRGSRPRRAYTKRMGYGKYNLPFEDALLDRAD
jgi:hypothetical protein